MSKYDIFFELNESAILEKSSDLFLVPSVFIGMDRHKKGPVFSYNVMREKNKIKEVRKRADSTPEFAPMVQRVLIASNEIYRHTAGKGNDNVVFSLNQLYHAMGYENEPGNAAIESIKKDVELLSGTIVNFKISDGYFEQGIDGHALEVCRIETEDETFFCLYRQPILMEYIENPFEFWSRNFSTMQKGLRECGT